MSASYLHLYVDVLPGNEIYISLSRTFCRTTEHLGVVLARETPIREHNLVDWTFLQVPFAFSMRLFQVADIREDASVLPFTRGKMFKPLLFFPILLAHEHVLGQRDLHDFAHRLEDNERHIRPAAAGRYFET